MRDDKSNLIFDLTWKFALDIMQYTKELQSLKKFNMANQLFKSGTSIGANVKESQNAESKNDFIHKMKIAAKEADETEYWLTLAMHAKSYPANEKLLTDLKSISNIISKIISSSKKPNLIP